MRWRGSLYCANRRGITLRRLTLLVVLALAAALAPAAAGTAHDGPSADGVEWQRATAAETSSVARLADHDASPLPTCWVDHAHGGNRDRKRPYEFAGGMVGISCNNAFVASGTIVADPARGPTRRHTATCDQPDPI